MADSGRAGGKSLMILEVLKGIQPATLSGDIVSNGLVQQLVIDGSTVRFKLAVDASQEAMAAEISHSAEVLLKQLDWVEAVEISTLDAPPRPIEPPKEIKPAQPAPQPKPAVNLLPNVKHVVAVGSGKGGVGKSTVSVNLALALAAAGHRVGLMDADVYGPSVPLMLGLKGTPEVSEDEKLLPLERYGIKVMSMGLLLKDDQAVVWRGPMVHGVVQQFLKDVEWGELDYLIVDLPPGTGDAALSLCQAIPLSAAVVVTTPQEVAASVAQKALSMFERMGIKIVGVIENMSYFICPGCDQPQHIFGEGGGHNLAQVHSLPFLGEIPLDIRMRKGGDVGEPVMVGFPDSELAAQFRDVAEGLTKSV